jgi:hypothetical protein
MKSTLLDRVFHLCNVCICMTMTTTTTTYSCIFFFSCTYSICIRTVRKTVREEESLSLTLSLSRVAAGVPEMEGGARIASS